MIRRDTKVREQAAVVRAIGHRLREARELCNLSQIDAAKRLGYANSSGLAKLERATDVRSVPLWVIQRAARVYRVSLDYLFGASDDWEGAFDGVERLADQLAELRERDLRALALHRREVERTVEAAAPLLEAAEALAEALTAYRRLNPTFEDSPGSAPVAGRLDRLLRQSRRSALALGRIRERKPKNEG